MKIKKKIQTGAERAERRMRRKDEEEKGVKILKEIIQNGD